MEGHAQPDQSSLDTRIAARLRELRVRREWSLDELAARSGVSRATLSRLENGVVSPTASVLGRLCAAHGLTMSRLMQQVETDFAAHLRPDDQPVWSDGTVAFTRRSVSPPAAGLSGEVLECEIGPGQRIDYDAPPRPGLEHHLVLCAGALNLTVGGTAHELRPGDCLRYRLDGPSAFETPADSGARYFLFIV